MNTTNDTYTFFVVFLHSGNPCPADFEQAGVILDYNLCLLNYYSAGFSSPRKTHINHEKDLEISSVFHRISECLYYCFDILDFKGKECNTLKLMNNEMLHVLYLTRSSYDNTFPELSVISSNKIKSSFILQVHC